MHCSADVGRGQEASTKLCQGFDWVGCIELAHKKVLSHTGIECIKKKIKWHKIKKNETHSSVIRNTLEGRGNAGMAKGRNKSSPRQIWNSSVWNLSITVLPTRPFSLR